MYLISLTLKYINTYMNKPLSKLKPILSPCSYELMLLKWSEVNWSEVVQSCPTLCDPMDWSPPGSSVQGLLQARILEWVAIPFSRGSSWPRVSHTAGRSFTIWATSEGYSINSNTQALHWGRSWLTTFPGVLRTPKASSFLSHYYEAGIMEAILGNITPKLVLVVPP